jgi:protein tyrosine/serine phosphatase
MNVDGVSNVRDIGGYINEDGLRIKQGMVYRSAKLDNVTDLGMYTLLYIMGVKTDLDLREADDATRPLGENVGYANAACPWYSTGENGIWANATTKSEFAKAIKVFAYEENYPIIFHCSMGRDRTGTTTFLLLGLLGVDEDTLRHEYYASFFSQQGGFDESEFPLLIINMNRLTEGLNEYGNEDSPLSERIEAFLLDTGVTPEESRSIRKIWLEA